MRITRPTMPVLGALLVLAHLLGCVRTTYTVVEMEQTARIKCTGNVADARLSILGEGEDLPHDIPLREGFLYALKPGEYEILVHRHGVRVVQRRIVLGDDQVFEIRIP